MTAERVSELGGGAGRFDRFPGVVPGRRRLSLVRGREGRSGRWRRRLLVLACLVVVLGLIGAVAGPRASSTAPAPSVVGSAARLVAADGLVVDCAGVKGPGLPAHVQLVPLTSPVWQAPKLAGAFEVWAIDAAGRILGGPEVRRGGDRLLGPPGAAYLVAVPAARTPVRSVASWQIGPACAAG